MTPAPPTAVVFDLDGTLVDTTYLHALAWWRTSVAHGLDIPFNRFHQLIGMGGDQLGAELFGGPRPDLEAGRAEQFRLLHDEVRLLPGARELVVAVAGMGHRVVIGTSGEPADVERSLDLLDVAGHLYGVVSSSEVDSSKPAPDIFERALTLAEVDPERAVVVGDTVWDARAAGAAGVASIGLLTGGHATRDLLEAGAAAVFDDPADLLADLDASPIGPLR
jgi:HAD superfamily hydrolase (TIGR01509 family)